LLLYVGSLQSKESDDRVEAKLDAVLHRLDPDNAQRLIAEINATYSGNETTGKAKIAASQS
jgi:hypothetical protein